MQQIFGDQLPLPMKVAIALVVVAVLLGVTIMLMRRLGRSVPSSPGRTGRRLSLVDAISLDPRRRLMLVRCDEMEHLLLVGGTNDVVVDADVGRRGAASVAASARIAETTLRESTVREPAISREAPAPRLAPAAPAAPLPKTESLPKTEPAPRVAAPEPQAPASVPAEAQAQALDAALSAPAQPEIKRPNLSRRPLLRGDGTISGRSSAGTGGGAGAAAGGSAPTISRNMPTRGQISRVAPRDVPPALPPVAEDAGTVVAAPAVEAPSPALTIAEIMPEAVTTEPARNEPARSEAAKSELAKSELTKSEPRLDDMAMRLDAALAEPADTPRLSLSDLLEDELAPAAAEPKDASDDDTKTKSFAESAPVPTPSIRPFEPAKVEPAMPTPTIERTRTAPADVMGRDAGGSERPAPRERPLDLRPATALSSADRPSRYAAPRRDAGFRAEPRPAGSEMPMPRPAGSEPPMRPREFSFRPAEAPTLANREPPRIESPRRPSAESELARPEISLRDLPKRDSERQMPDPAARAEPVLSARRWEPPRAPAERVDPAAPQPALELPTVLGADKDRTPPQATNADLPAIDDPLGDFDAEMANLLGRTTASGH